VPLETKTETVPPFKVVKLRAAEVLGYAELASVYHHLISLRFVLSRLRPYLTFKEKADEVIPLNGMAVVVTGKFDVTRSSLKKKLVAAGFVLRPKVTKKVDFLLAGRESGN